MKTVNFIADILKLSAALFIFFNQPPSCYKGSDLSLLLQDCDRPVTPGSISNISLVFLTIRLGQYNWRSSAWRRPKVKKEVIPNRVAHYKIKKGLSLSNGDFTFLVPENRLRIQLNILVNINTGFWVNIMVKSPEG